MRARALKTSQIRGFDGLFRESDENGPILARDLRLELSQGEENSGLLENPIGRELWCST
jgi:hypothetical protein